MLKLTHDTKYNRAQIFERLLKLKKNPSESLNEFEIDAFLMYFAPPTPKTPKTAFDWVAKAVADDRDIRKYLHYVHVENGVAAASDGYRLHFANVDLPDGYFDARTGLATDVDKYFKYPDWRRMLTGEAGAKMCTSWEDALTTNGKKPESLVLIDNYSFLKAYLDAALATNENTKIFGEGMGARAYGENQFGTFLVACRRD